MTPPLTIPLIITSLAVSILLPVALFAYFRLTHGLTIRTVAVGAIIWILFSQILEKLLHAVVLTHTGIMFSPVAFAVYGAITAGVFEEVGRYIAFRFILPSRRSWKDAVGYGIGHGGIESILLGLALNLQYLVFARMQNAGTLSSFHGIPQSALATLQATLLGSPWVFLLGGIERICALAVQIALSILVLRAVADRRISYLVYAILLHAAVDFAPALFQIGAARLIEAEAMVAVAGIIAVAYIRKTGRKAAHSSRHAQRRHDKTGE